MKSIKIISLVAFLFLFGISSIEAQEKKQNNQQNQSQSLNENQGMDNAALLENLSEEQLLMINEQREQIKKHRALFKASFNEAQFAIFENTKLTKQEKHDALMTSLTKAQKAMLSEHKASVQESKQQFKNTITSEQRQQIRSRMQTNKETQGVNELRETIKENRKQHGKN
ncbi:hypothetical protein [Lutibacter sp.]|uniref:hypothetical protein n=1 Tax=Lutibacter sp. TaxID=1925666 RepID=UPI003569A258